MHPEGGRGVLAGLGLVARPTEPVLHVGGLAAAHQRQIEGHVVVVAGGAGGFVARRREVQASNGFIF